MWTLIRQGVLGNLEMEHMSRYIGLHRYSMAYVYFHYCLPIYLYICGRKAFNSIHLLVLCYNDLNGDWIESKVKSLGPKENNSFVPPCYIDSKSWSLQGECVLRNVFRSAADTAGSRKWPLCSYDLQYFSSTFRPETWSHLAASAAEFQMFAGLVCYRPLHHVHWRQKSRARSLQQLLSPRVTVSCDKLTASQWLKACPLFTWHWNPILCHSLKVLTFEIPYTTPLKIIFYCWISWRNYVICIHLTKQISRAKYVYTLLSKQWPAISGEWLRTNLYCDLVKKDVK